MATEALTCDDTELSTESLIRELFVVMSDGSYAVKYTTATGGDPIDCDLSDYPTMAMLRGAIVRVDGVLALQIQEVS